MIKKLLENKTIKILIFFIAAILLGKISFTWWLK